MTDKELFELISEIIPLLNKPTLDELNEIVRELKNRSKTKYVTNNDLIEIVNNCVSDTTIKAQESIDMTASINIAKQILDKLKNKTQG